jgi:hypothetical protein
MLLARLEQEVGTEKTASLVDALIGAPIGAVAARISAKEEEKDEATKRGLLVGALLGFLAGQRAVSASMRGEDIAAYEHPLFLAAAGGAGVGAYSHIKNPIGAAIARARAMKTR